MAGAAKQSTEFELGLPMDRFVASLLATTRASLAQGKSPTEISAGLRTHVDTPIG